MPYAFYLSPQDSTAFPKRCFSSASFRSPPPPEGTRSHPFHLKSAASSGDFTRFVKVCFQLRWWVFPLLPRKPPWLECSSALFEPCAELGSSHPPASAVRRRVVTRQHRAALPVRVLVLQLTELRIIWIGWNCSQSVNRLLEKNTIACAKPKIA